MNGFESQLLGPVLALGVSLDCTVSPWHSGFFLKEIGGVWISDLILHRGIWYRDKKRDQDMCLELEVGKLTGVPWFSAADSIDHKEHSHCAACHVLFGFFVLSRN